MEPIVESAFKPPKRPCAPRSSNSMASPLKTMLLRAARRRAEFACHRGECFGRGSAALRDSIYSAKGFRGYTAEDDKVKPNCNENWELRNENCSLNESSS